MVNDPTQSREMRIFPDGPNQSLNDTANEVGSDPGIKLVDINSPRVTRTVTLDITAVFKVTRPGNHYVKVDPPGDFELVNNIKTSLPPSGIFSSPSKRVDYIGGMDVDPEIDEPSFKLGAVAVFGCMFYLYQEASIDVYISSVEGRNPELDYDLDEGQESPSWVKVGSKTVKRLPIRGFDTLHWENNAEWINSYNTDQLKGAAISNQLSTIGSAGQPVMADQFFETDVLPRQRLIPDTEEDEDPESRLNRIEFKNPYDEPPVVLLSMVDVSDKGIFSEDEDDEPEPETETPPPATTMPVEPPPASTTGEAGDVTVPEEPVVTPLPEIITREDPTLDDRKDVTLGLDDTKREDSMVAYPINITSEGFSISYVSKDDVLSDDSSKTGEIPPENIEIHYTAIPKGTYRVTTDEYLFNANSTFRMEVGETTTKNRSFGDSGFSAIPQDPRRSFFSGKIYGEVFNEFGEPELDGGTAWIQQYDPSNSKYITIGVTDFTGDNNYTFVNLEEGRDYRVVVYNDERSGYSDDDAGRNETKFEPEDVFEDYTEGTELPGDLTREEYEEIYNSFGLDPDNSSIVSNNISDEGELVTPSFRSVNALAKPETELVVKTEAKTVDAGTSVTRRGYPNENQGKFGVVEIKNLEGEKQQNIDYNTANPPADFTPSINDLIRIRSSEADGGDRREREFTILPSYEESNNFKGIVGEVFNQAGEPLRGGGTAWLQKLDQTGENYTTVKTTDLRRAYSEKARKKLGIEYTPEEKEELGIASEKEGPKPSEDTVVNKFTFPNVKQDEDYRIVVYNDQGVGYSDNDPGENGLTYDPQETFDDYDPSTPELPGNLSLTEHQYIFERFGLDPTSYPLRSRRIAEDSSITKFSSDTLTTIAEPETQVITKIGGNSLQAESDANREYFDEDEPKFGVYEFNNLRGPEEFEVQVEFSEPTPPSDFTTSINNIIKERSEAKREFENETGGGEEEEESSLPENYVEFDKSFVEKPCVFYEFQGMNQKHFKIPHVTNISKNGFLPYQGYTDVYDKVEEARRPGRVEETFGYIAVEPFRGNVLGMDVEIMRSSIEFDDYGFATLHRTPETEGIRYRREGEGKLEEVPDLENLTDEEIAADYRRDIRLDQAKRNLGPDGWGSGSEGQITFETVQKALDLYRNQRPTLGDLFAGTFFSRMSGVKKFMEKWEQEYIDTGEEITIDLNKFDTNNSGYIDWSEVIDAVDAAKNEQTLVDTEITANIAAQLMKAHFLQVRTGAIEDRDTYERDGTYIREAVPHYTDYDNIEDYISRHTEYDWNLLDGHGQRSTGAAFDIMRSNAEKRKEKIQIQDAKARDFIGNPKSGQNDGREEWVQYMRIQRLRDIEDVNVATWGQWKNIGLVALPKPSYVRGRTPLRPFFCREIAPEDSNLNGIPPEDPDDVADVPTEPPEKPPEERVREPTDPDLEDDLPTDPDEGIPEEYPDDFIDNPEDWPDDFEDDLDDGGIDVPEDPEYPSDFDDLPEDPTDIPGVEDPEEDLPQYEDLPEDYPDDFPEDPDMWPGEDNYDDSVPEDETFPDKPSELPEDPSDLPVDPDDPKKPDVLPEKPKIPDEYPETFPENPKEWPEDFPEPGEDGVYPNPGGGTGTGGGGGDGGDGGGGGGGTGGVPGGGSGLPDSPYDLPGTPDGPPDNLDPSLPDIIEGPGGGDIPEDPPDRTVPEPPDSGNDLPGDAAPGESGPIAEAPDEVKRKIPEEVLEEIEDGGLEEPPTPGTTLPSPGDGPGGPGNVPDEFKPPSVPDPGEGVPDGEGPSPPPSESLPDFGGGAGPSIPPPEPPEPPDNIDEIDDVDDIPEEDLPPGTDPEDIPPGTDPEDIYQGGGGSGGTPGTGGGGGNSGRTGSDDCDKPAIGDDVDWLPDPNRCSDEESGWVPDEDFLSGFGTPDLSDITNPPTEFETGDDRDIMFGGDEDSADETTGGLLGDFSGDSGGSGGGGSGGSDGDSGGGGFLGGII